MVFFVADHFLFHFSSLYFFYFFSMHFGGLRSWTRTSVSIGTLHLPLSLSVYIFIY